MRNGHPKSSEGEHSISELLHRLSSVDAGPAWVEFLDRYAQLIMNTANQFEYEREQINECFIYVCEKLNDNGFRRLLNFNTRGAAKFSTWLGTVVFNLCVDWHRREFGRVTLLPAISALSEFDQSVYRLSIEQKMNKEVCFQTLRANFPDLTRDQVANSLERVYSLLTLFAASSPLHAARILVIDDSWAEPMGHALEGVFSSNGYTDISVETTEFWGLAARLSSQEGLDFITTELSLRPDVAIVHPSSGINDVHCTLVGSECTTNWNPLLAGTQSEADILAKIMADVEIIADHIFSIQPDANPTRRSITTRPKSSKS